MKPVITSVKTFSFTNPSGGTGTSTGRFDPQFSHAEATVSVVRVFSDYEVGLRFVGVSASPALSTYLGQVAKVDNKRIYFSEHELARPDSANALVQQLAVAVGVVTTSDGYRFVNTDEGKWTDGDMTFESFSDLMDSADFNVEVEGMLGCDQDGG